MSSDGSVFTSDKFFVQDISCTIQLQVHQWKVVFNYHGEKVCLKICREGALPEYYVRTAAEWRLKNIWKIGGLKNCASL